jgi:hypothetical protein
MTTSRKFWDTYLSSDRPDWVLQNFKGKFHFIPDGKMLLSFIPIASEWDKEKEFPRGGRTCFWPGDRLTWRGWGPSYLIDFCPAKGNMFVSRIVPKGVVATLMQDNVAHILSPGACITDQEILECDVRPWLRMGWRRIRRLHRGATA